jgi:hypothetical protein
MKNQGTWLDIHVPKMLKALNTTGRSWSLSKAWRWWECCDQYGQGETTEVLWIDGSMSWTVFHCQLKAVAEHSNWTAWEEATYLPTVLQGQTTYVLYLQCPSMSSIQSSLRHSMTIVGTTNWMWHRVPNWKPRCSWAESHCKNWLLQLSGWHTMPLVDYLNAVSGRRHLVHSLKG